MLDESKAVLIEITSSSFGNKDVYDVEYCSGFSTKEFSVTIDLEKEIIYGTTVQHGGWYGLTEDEIWEVIDLVRSKGKLIREYENLKYVRE